MRLFEWDERKRKGNIAKHAVDFAHSLLIFENPIVTHIDDRRNYGETRQISLGFVGNEFFVVVHTERAGSTRLISAWKGGHDEEIFYQECLARRCQGHAGEGGGVS